MHGVTHTIEQIRERGVPGFEVEVVGTDRRRRPPPAGGRRARGPLLRGDDASASPACPTWSRPSPRAATTSSTSPPPARPAIAATLLGRITGVPLLASYHTELAAYAGMRSGDGGLEAMARVGPRRLLRRALGRALAEPGRPTRSLAELGAEPARIGRWERGVDISTASTRPRPTATPIPGEIKVLYAGRLTREKGVDLLAESFLRAHARRPAPAPAARRRRPRGGRAARRGSASAPPSSAGSRARSWPRAYASADVFLFCQRTDTYGQVILEAGASGLPVVAVAEGGPAALIENRHTGLLCRPDADHLAGARAAARRLAAAAPPARRRRRPRRPRAAPGSARWSSSPPATGGRSTRRRRRQPLARVA